MFIITSLIPLNIKALELSAYLVVLISACPNLLEIVLDSLINK